MNLFYQHHMWNLYVILQAINPQNRNNLIFSIWKYTHRRRIYHSVNRVPLLFLLINVLPDQILSLIFECVLFCPEKETMSVFSKSIKRIKKQNSFNKMIKYSTKMNVLFSTYFFKEYFSCWKRVWFFQCFSLTFWPIAKKRKKSEIRTNLTKNEVKKKILLTKEVIQFKLISINIIPNLSNHFRSLHFIIEKIPH